MSTLEGFHCIHYTPPGPSPRCLLLHCARTHVECSLEVSDAAHDAALFLVGVDVLLLAGEVGPAHQGRHVLEHGLLTPFQSRLQSNTVDNKTLIKPRLHHVDRIHNKPFTIMIHVMGGGVKVGTEGKFTWKHACFCAFMFINLHKSTKHARFHIFFPFIGSPLHQNGKGSVN